MDGALERRADAPVVPVAMTAELYSFPRHINAREIYWSYRAQGYAVAQSLEAAAIVDGCPDDFVCGQCAEPCVIGDAHVLRSPHGKPAGVICGRCDVWIKTMKTLASDGSVDVLCTHCGKPLSPTTSIAVTRRGLQHTYHCT